MGGKIREKKIAEKMRRRFTPEPLPRAIPRTCREAADRFREWHEAATEPLSKVRYLDCALILDAFGDAPVPQAILDAWDFTGP